MKHTFMIVVLASTLAGCLVRSGPRRTVVREKRSCPPAHHWENGYCVHNGHGHGNGNGHGKHDRD